MSNHPIVHIEFSSKDTETPKFYEDIFGWEITEVPEMNYTLFEYDEGRGGGFNPVTGQNPAGTVIVYIQADDIEGTLEKIESKGGQVLVPKSEIPETGWFALFSDPTGNQVALYKPMKTD